MTGSHMAALIRAAKGRWPTCYGTMFELREGEMCACGVGAAYCLDQGVAPHPSRDILAWAWALGCDVPANHFVGAFDDALREGHPDPFEAAACAAEQWRPAK